MNLVFLQPRMGGLETYVRRLIPALLEANSKLELELFVGARGAEALKDEPWIDGVKIVRHPLLGRRNTKALTELTLLGALASRRQLDVLHSVALTAPLWTRPANVLTVADVTWLHEPDHAERHTVRLWRLVVPLAARRADRVIAISEATRTEINEDLRVPLDRIDVVPLGPGFQEARPTPEGDLRRRLGLGNRPIILAVSALKAHKNVGALIDAMRKVQTAVPDAVLVVPGNPTPLRATLEERARAIGVKGAVVFPGWVDSHDLEGLYRSARCFAFPSLREGFGLPILEAMIRGLPVACAPESAMREVAGDAALYFDPRSSDSISDAVVRLLVDQSLADRLAAAGLERQKHFTWRKTAEQTLEVYERAVAS